MEEFKNPLNTESIIDSIRNYPNDTEKVIEIIATVFPTWIQNCLKHFSKDYSQFEKNWEKVCSNLKTVKTQIILIKYISLEEDYSLIRFFCDILTSRGFLVRTYDELFPCEVCEKALPTEKIYAILDKKFKPEKWSTMCSECQ